MQNLNGQKRNKVTMKKLVVIGSSNMDLVVSTEHFPLPSQTVMGNKFMTNFGGKGANQAVAASLLGGDVTFICKVGNDNYGREMIEKFQKDGIDTQYVTATDQAATGIAVITVDANGENTIVVASVPTVCSHPKISETPSLPFLKPMYCLCSNAHRTPLYSSTNGL